MCGRSKKRWHERPHLGVENRRIGGQYAKLQIMRISDQDSFYKFMRFYPEDFDKLLHLVGPLITKYDFIREAINPSTRLALTLRFLATGESQRSLAMNYLVGESTAHCIVTETTRAIWQVLQPLEMPEPTREMFENIARGFLERWDFPNCCGSADGKLMPKFSGSDFFCYKNYHAVDLLGVCDHMYRFAMVDVGAKGRQSDGGVFANSRLGRKLKSNRIDQPPPKEMQFGPYLSHFFLGDEAFSLSTYMMTPYSGKATGKLSYTKRNFNYRQSRGRRVIENTFGLMVSTWRIYKTEIDCDLGLIDNIVLATTCLHNYRLSLNHSNKYFVQSSVDHEKNGELIPGDWRKTDSNLDQIALQLGRHSSAEAVQMRDELAEYFLDAGSVPWQHNMI